MKINSQKNPSHFVLTKVSRECEGGTSLAGWLSVGDSSYKRFIGKKLSENKFTKNPSRFVLTQVSRVKEGPRWQAGCQLEMQER